ncbi:family 78 glycoside hydrolase catalytic domain [Patulibacter defluvii]|uniref:family 78 glycoside hydrolase catalytic domain n=1 Tax=Patulibacter defluvii TaxID=3095358 RepID=UPI002A7601CD|nr:family 78 glycoside hydrolase catalytic domain [Patulibacter sp. DM4]
MELPHRWDAKWLWLGDSGHRPGLLVGTADPAVHDRFLLLRRSFTLDEVPAEARLRAVANSRLIVWINGHEVARGPVRSDARSTRSEQAPVADRLRPGRNVIAVLARYYGTATAWWLPTPVTLGLGGAAVAVELRLADGTVVASDERWRARAGDAWTPGPRTFADGSGFPREIVDARRLPAGWTAVDFDDGDWSPAEPIDPRNDGYRGVLEPPSDPFGPLPPRPIPQLTGGVRGPLATAVFATDGAAAPAAEDDPVAQVLADQRSAVAARPIAVAADRPVAVPAGLHLVAFDFGRTVAGHVRLDVEGPAGTQVDLALGEQVDDHGLLVAELTHAGLRYIARGADDRHESFDPVGGRYAAAAVRAPGPVRLRVAVRERLFPPARPASPPFRCSDELLNDVFAIGLRTVDLCAQDAYIDCPTREARAWTGDFVVHQSVHLATADDWSLARWHPQLADAPRADGMLPMAVCSNLGGGPLEGSYIPDWALHWIRAVRNLMRYTGDRELVASLLPSCERVLRWFLPYRGPDGLLDDVPGWVLIDWSAVPVAGTSAALNGLWARGLRDLAEIAEWLGDGHRTAWARGLHEGVAAGFELFWDPERALYRDQRLAGRVGPAASRHGNAAAICAGIVPAERLAGLAETLADRGPLAHSAPAFERLGSGDLAAGVDLVTHGNPEPEWDQRQRILEAQPFFRYVVHDALAEAGRADLVADACRDWGRFVRAGERTWPETWVGGSHCHGWSATPTRDLIVHTLGIQPAEPGFARARVAPALGDLAWAEGSAPTPHGRLRVRADGERGRLTIESPVPVDAEWGGERRRLGPGRHQLELATS